MLIAQWYKTGSPRVFYVRTIALHKKMTKPAALRDRERYMCCKISMVFPWWWLRRRKKTWHCHLRTSLDINKGRQEKGRQKARTDFICVAAELVLKSKKGKTELLEKQVFSAFSSCFWFINGMQKLCQTRDYSFPERKGYKLIGLYISRFISRQ